MYIIIRSAYERKILWKALGALMVGFILSLSWWVFKFGRLIQMNITEEKIGEVASVAASSSSFSKIMAYIPRLFSPTGGSGTKAYSFSDFFVAHTNNMINNPIGWGIVISLLLVSGIIFLIMKRKELFQKEHYWMGVILAWFIILFLAVNSVTFNLPLGLEAFRIWMLLAIPVSILAAYGLITITKSSKGLGILIGIVLILAVIATSGYQKYSHNTTPNWPPGGKWTSADEIKGYIWMKENTPLNSKVFTYSSQNKVVIGFNMDACVWCLSHREFQDQIMNHTVEEVYRWLKQENYQYLVFGGMEFKYLGNLYGKEIASEKITKDLAEISQHPGQFQVIYQNKGFVIFKLE